MSMTGHFRYVSQAVYDKVVAEPELARQVRVYSIEEDGIPPEIRAIFRGAPESAVLEMKRRLALDGLDKLFVQANAAAKEALAARGIGPEELGPVLYVEKAWHGLHVVLAGTKWEPTAPPGDAVLGGRPLGPAEGHGPMRFLSRDEVRVTAAALAAISNEEFGARCTTELLARHEAYATQPDDPRDRAWLLDAFVRVRGYYTGAAAQSQAMALYVL
jgi:hypothetical protein